MLNKQREAEILANLKTLRNTTMEEREDILHQLMKVSAKLESVTSEIKHRERISDVGIRGTSQS